jgi:cobalt-zinc-cadmium efflux system outer membrane protein
VGELGSTPSLPPFEDLRGRLVRTPLVQQWNTTTDLARAALARERAAAVPDVAFAVSLSHERATRAEVLGLALSAPLPLFDRNRGGIAAAASELEAARSEEAGIRAWLQAELEKNRQAFEAAREELDMIRDQLVPGARIAVRAAEESYRNGKVEYLVLLEAQRVLYDTEMQRIEAAADLDRTVAEIESLVATGTHR